MKNDEDDGLGGRFWFGLVGGTIAIGIALLVIFLLIGVAVWAWGIFGAFIFFGAIPRARRRGRLRGLSHRRPAEKRAV
jgi:hypothetical protein